MTTETTIHTERLILRSWIESDRDAFAALNADQRVMEFFPSLLSNTDSNATAERIQTHLETHGWGLWAIEIPGMTRFAGFVGLAVPRFQAHFTPCTEIGWRLATAFWGKGYASEAARAALAFGFDKLRLPEIVSFTAQANQRSMRVMERIGMARDPADDFEHPSLPGGHWLRPHVLYRKQRPPDRRPQPQ